MFEMRDILRYGSERHNEILSAIRERKKMSYDKMQKYHDSWNRAEDAFRMYLPARLEDRRRAARRDAGVPQYTDIVVPYSYAILMAYHMYMSTVFLSRTPIWQFQSRSGAKEQTALGLESLLEYQTLVGEMLPALFVWLLDTGKYGVGFLGNYWDTKTQRIVTFEERPAMSAGVVDPNRPPEKVKVTRPVVIYEGNRVFNIRPQDFFPDPRVPIMRFHEGEFCGYNTVAPWNEIVKNDYYFNKDHIPRQAPSWERRDSSTPSSEGPATQNAPVKFGRDAVRLFECMVDLIPKDWGLGESALPEKWVFCVANDAVIIGARPHGAMHDRYPYFLNLYEIEGHDFIGRGILELLKPLNDGMTWLLNSHFYNVRKALNDNYIVDPSRIVMQDLEGGPGRIVRLRPLAYGTPIDNAFKQLPTMDITRSHISDMQVMADFMQRMTGVMDTVMGMLDPGGRKTATEVRNAGSFSTNRLKTQAEWNSALGWIPLAMCLLANTQQYLESPQQVRIAGGRILDGQPTITVSPEDIAGQYDYIPIDGTLPIDRAQQAMLLTELFKTVAGFSDPATGGNPILQSYNLGEIFAWVAQLLGLKNIDRFRLVPLPDAQILQQARRGNLIPTPVPGGVPGNGVQPQALR